ncbi:hypothetical protein HDV01_007282 [Terramyces sp. JEL0728]|nr:hypothetical protein HDV01_007282 [Terramyces sp. JEL0728]
MGKRDAEQQLDSYNWQADNEDDGPQEFQKASEREISKRQIKPLRKGIRKTAAANPVRSNPYANAFKPADSTPTPSNSLGTGLFGIPTANNPVSVSVAPALTSKADNSNEIKVFAEKIVGLNNSFLKQITDHVKSKSNIDLTVLCNDYIRFRKEIIAAQPKEESSKAPLFGSSLNDSNLKALEKEEMLSDASSKPPLFTNNFKGADNQEPDKELSSAPLFGVSRAPAVTAGEKSQPQAPAFSFGTSAPLFSVGDDSEKKDSTFNFKAPTTNLFAKPDPSKDLPKEVSPAATFSFGAPKDDTKSTPAFSFGAPKTDTASSKPTFSFGAPMVNTTSDKPVSFAAPKTTDSSDKPAFSFSALSKPDGTPAPAFSFGTPKTDIATPTPAPKGDAPASTFAFGAPKADVSTSNLFGAPKGDAPASTFAFGAPKETTTAFSFTAPKTDAAAKPAFSFNAPSDGSKPAFSFGAPKSDTPAFSFATPKTDDKPTSLVANMADPKPLNSSFQFSKPEVQEEGDAMPELSQVGDSLMHGEGEENEKSVHEQKSKIFVQVTTEEGKKDWNAIGVGILKIKETRLLCRAENSGRVLLNARLYNAMKLTKVGDKQFTTILMHEEQMKPVLIRCGKVDETNKLIEVIQETAKKN